MSFISEFKTFAMRGNVIDLAVGVVAFAIFLVVKLMNRVVRKEEAAPAAPAEDVVLLTQIRDLLKQRQP